jgi:hypothetical protein
MPIIDYQDVLKGLLVQEGMRRQVIRLPERASLEQAIRGTIRFKSMREREERGSV